MTRARIRAPHGVPTALGLRTAALACAALLGCTGARPGGLTAPPARDTSGGGRAPGGAQPTPEGVTSLVHTPLSQRLGCGGPCAPAGVDAAGACRDGVAIRCEGGTVLCDDCGPVSRECVASGGVPARCVRECEGEEVCPAGGTCFDRVCCPHARWCEQGAQVICNDSGTSMVNQPCLEGLDCVGGQCIPAQPYVHVIFDTSGSMIWRPDGTPLTYEEAVETSQWPGCDDPADPLLRLGVSKRAFSAIFDDPAYSRVMFGLQRFPQRIDPLAGPLCPSGAYQTQDVITGHIGQPFAIPDDGSGAWFQQNLSEVLLVAFPTVAASTNRADLLAWLDFDEELLVTESPCTAHTDCPGGLCTQPGGGGVCRYFRNPELRALGWTPLGVSLFYAGEYFRKHVVTDGAPCTLAADCGSAAYYCIDGRCRDPNRFCRQRTIVVFTDGVDTASAGRFYQPVVQAKRLRMGLDCTGAADCAVGAECVASTCQPTGEAGMNPCAHLGLNCTAPPMTEPYPEAMAAGAGRLRDRNGDPISITVHVVEASGGVTADAAGMAAYGGGLLVPADLADGASLIQKIQGVVNWKDPDFCAAFR